MPAKSKSQARYFGVLEAYNKGELKNPSEKVKKAATTISKGDVRDFASTPRKGLPEKVKKR